MNQNTFNKIVGVVFLIVTIVHLIRVIQGWSIIIGGVSIPGYVSWLAVIVAGCLSYQGFVKKL
ncbi:MAG: hypothetical protein Q8Q03_02465 [bacterium]|nr:hypothetical protein [bacterium]